MVSEHFGYGPVKLLALA